MDLCTLYELEFPIRRLHPLKQREAYIRCHIHSDTDVAVLLKEDALSVKNDVTFPGKIE